MSRPLIHVAGPRTATLCCALAAALGCFPAYAQTGTPTLTPGARTHFTQARQAQEAGQLNKAAEEYAQTIRLAPTFAGAYANLGLIHYLQGSFELSSDALKKAVHLDPTLLGANLYLGIDLLKLNHPAQALPYLQHAAQLDPANKDAESWLGTAYWQAGQPWTALEQLRQTNSRFPNDPDLLFVLGETYRKTADQELQTLIHTAAGTPFLHQVYGDIYLEQHAFAKAAGHYRAASRQTPAPPNIHFKLAEVDLLTGHTQAAADEYRKQLQLTPANAAATARLAQASLLEAQVPAALSLLDQALALSPLETVGALHLPPSFASPPDTFSDQALEHLRAALSQLELSPGTPARNLAIALLSANLGLGDRLQRAWADFQSAIPPQPPASTLLARALQDLDRQSYDTSAEELHTWLLAHPADLEAQYLAAQTHRLLSLAILDTLLANHPDSFRSHQLLAQTYEQRDEDEKAIAEYRRVEDLAPTLPGIHYALGHLLLKAGDLDQATLQLKAELHLAPDFPEANAELGIALLAQGQPEAAVPCLTRAVSLDPGLTNAHQELGKAFYLQKNYSAARRELTLALADDPEGLAHYQLGLVYKALGETDAATREFDSSRKIKSDRLAQVQLQLPDESPSLAKK